MLGVRLEPVGDVPAHRIDLAISAFLDVGDSALDEDTRIAVAAESGDREGSRQGDRVSVVAVVEHAHEPVSYTHLTLPTNREV